MCKEIGDGVGGRSDNVEGCSISGYRLLGLHKPHPSPKLTLTETQLVTRLVVLHSLPDLTPTLYTWTCLVVLHRLPDNPNPVHLYTSGSAA